MLSTVPATRFNPAPNVDIRFPPLPSTVAEVCTLLAEQNANPDTRRLIEAVNLDPVIAASVLRRINSAHYGMRRLIGDVQTAVLLLGFLEVCNIVMTAALLKLVDTLPSREQRGIFNETMRVSVTAAHYMHGIAHTITLNDKSIAFTAGLLHAMGRLVLLYNKPHDYEALWYSGEPGSAPSIEAERLIFGTDHALLGALAADRWNLPGKIGALIGKYHTPEAIADTDLRKLAYALALASTTAEASCLGAETPASDDPPEVLTAFANALEMSPGEAVCLLETIRAQIPELPEELLRN